MDKIAILKNVGSSWIALGANVVVGIFLSPYILHRLGDEAFGIWVLIFSVTGYYGLFDLGIRSSIVRYVAKYSATGEHEELNRLINTAIFSYTMIGVLAFLVTLAGAMHLTSIFPAALPVHRNYVTARWRLTLSCSRHSLYARVSRARECHARATIVASALRSEVCGSC